nr:reverse transcriptase domain-containing protein [Tanacetum cinerariifolium]
MTSLINSNLELKNMFGQFMKMNTASSSGSGTLPSNTITKPKEDLKGITTRSETVYQGPTIPTTSSSLPQVVEHETEVTKDTVAPKPNPKPSIPYPSRLHAQKLRDKTNDQKEKFFKIFKDLYFNISFANALILMPKYGPTIKSLLTNKDKLYELARTPLNEHCSAVLLKKLPEKLGDPDKFLIPCDFPRMDEYLTLADLGACINLMSLSVWNKLSLPELTPTLMTLELADRLISQPISVARANRIDVIDIACEECSQEVLGFSNVIVSDNPTPYYDSIISTFSPNLTPFGDNDFLLEEVDTFLALEDDPTSPEVDHSYYDTKGDILLFEAFLNDDPSLPPPTQRMYLPQVELKDLPPHLEYVFLEGDDKLTIIIAKNLSVKEKSALIKVLKPHKQAISWKLSDIKGINLEFCTHKILMEDDFKPAVRHQRRVNLKIQDVIKMEVLKLLDAGLIYLISDSPWRVCIDYHKLNEATRKDHFPLSFMDQMLERFPRNEYYCFLDGFSGYFQIPIDPKDQEKTTFTCPYEIFAYRRMPFKLCNAPEGIVLSHKISKNRIEVDKAKVDVIAKLPHPTTGKDIRSFLGHADFYR